MTKQIDNQFKLLLSALIQNNTNRAFQDIDSEFFSMISPAKVLELFTTVSFDQNLEALKSLVDLGVLDMIDLEHFNPLCIVIKDQFLEGVQYLSNYSELLESNLQNGETTLTFAMKHGDDEIVKALVDKAENLFQNNQQDENIVTLSLKRENKEILNYIREKHPEIDKLILKVEEQKQWNEVGSALTKVFAIAENDYSNQTLNFDQIMDEMVGKVERTQKDIRKMEESFLKEIKDHFIRVSEEKKAKIEHILPKNININTANERGQTLFMIAAQRGQYQLLKEMGSRSPSVSLRDIHGRNIVHYAIESVDKNIFNLLKTWGADFNAQDKKMMTPLFYAIKKESEAAVKLLLDAGAKPNKHCQNVYPLHLAAQKGNLKICQILIDHGASNYQADTKGRTPADIAFDSGHTAASIYLRKLKVG